METILKQWPSLTLSDKNKVLIFNCVAYLFILLFIYTATDKLWNISQFVEFFNKLAILKYFGTFLAWAVPLTEVSISLLLFFPRTRFLGHIAAGILMVTFTIYLIYMKFTSPALPCSCGGVISKLNWTQHIWFNAIFIILSTLAIIYKPDNKTKMS
jgi:hydrogenase-4 membrane subunit HyfE